MTHAPVPAVAIGRLSTIVMPPPGVSSTRMLAADRFDESLRDRQARDRRPCRCRCRRAAGTAGTARSRCDERVCRSRGRRPGGRCARRRAPASMRTGRSAAECRTRVVDDVRDRPLDQRGVDLDARQRFGHLDDDVAARVAEARERGRHDLVEPDRFACRDGARPPATGSCRAGSRRACGAGRPRRRSLRMNSCVSACDHVDVGLQPAARLRLDRRERRAQVVAHRREQRVPQVVRAREISGGARPRPRGGASPMTASRYESRVADEPVRVDAEAAGPVITSTWPSRRS